MGLAKAVIMIFFTGNGSPRLADLPHENLARTNENSN
jgi:hypothetical protein